MKPKDTVLSKADIDYLDVSVEELVAIQADRTEDMLRGYRRRIAQGTVTYHCICDAAGEKPIPFSHCKTCIMYNEGKKYQANVSFTAGVDYRGEKRLHFFWYWKRSWPRIRFFKRTEGEWYGILRAGVGGVNIYREAPRLK